MYTYKCIITDIKDGDTVVVDIDLGFRAWLHDISIRVNGIDAPETRTKDLIEKRWGVLSKSIVEKLIPIGSTQIITTVIDRDKFGRVLGDFSLNETTLSKYMVENHYAIVYQDDDVISKSENRSSIIRFPLVLWRKLMLPSLAFNGTT